MTTKKNVIIISIVLINIFLIVIYCKKTNELCIGCGGCEYEKFTDTIKVEKIVYKSDSIDYINFKSTVNSNLKYQEDSWELSFRIGKDFSEKEIKDTLNKYSITGERITKGTCTPYSIKDMKLIKK
ncbi:hypothetical protein [Flavobacterium sp.]|jgi:hypothetical protein|uniref:hypothetical protein n=1 Tax=Flavobacterium sp. TaxID=239 RepID=UPI0037C1283C